MADSLGTAYIDVRADTTGVAKSLDQGVTKAAKNSDKAVGGLGATLKGLGPLAGAAVGGAAVTALVNFGKAAVDAASDLGESMNAVNVSFGDAAAGIHALGAESAESFGLSERAFNDFAVRFSSFAETIAAEGGGTVAGVVEEMTTRIADFASVMNLDMTEAATVFQSGLAGEAEAFRRFGVDLSAAAVSAKALEIGLAESSSELTEQDKILGRYELIMEQTDETSGDFLNTSDSLANSQRILAANIEDTEAKIGKLLIPTVAEATGAFNDMVTIGGFAIDALSADKGVAGAIGDVIENATKMAPVIGPVVSLLGTAADVWDRIAGSITDAEDAQKNSTSAYETGTAVINDYNAQAEAVAAATSRANDEFSKGPSILHDYNVQGAEAADIIREQAENTYDAAAALEVYQNKIRAQTDPLFALFDATNRVAEADADVVEARKEFGRNSPEYEQAIVDQTIANQDLFFAQQDVRTETDLSKDAFINQRIAMGDTREEAERVADILYEIEGIKLTPKVLGVSIDTPQFIRDLVEKSRPGGFQKQTGGPVLAGVPYTVGEAGRELFVPNVDGTILPHGQTQAVLAGSGTAQSGGTTVVQHFYTEPIPTPATQRAMQEAAAVIGLTQ